MARAASDPPTVASLEVFEIRVNQRGNWLVARLKSDSGVTGLGDASHGAADSQTISFLQRYFFRMRGRGIFDVEMFRRELFPEIAKSGRSAAAAFGALEQCLWDMQGKVLGVPAYQLFGGKLGGAIRNYANINRSAAPRNPEGFARMAQAAVAAGFEAVKLAPFDGMPRGVEAAKEKHVRQAIECIKAVREAMGPKRDLLVDVHDTLSLERAVELDKELEPLKLFWLEEVTPKVDDLAAFNRAAKAPTAGGELIFGLKAFHGYMAAGAVDIAMPDPKYCGGLLEMKRVGALSEAMGLEVSPHGPASPVGNAAAAHVCATMPNFLILEHAYGEVPWRAELVDPPETLEHGHMTLSQRPGFGIELNEKIARKYAA